jgi:hypothetical protein
MQRQFCVVLIVVGVFLCAWAVIPAALSQEGVGRVQLEPRFYLGLGLVLAGIISLLIDLRKKRGPDQR